jgi:aspartyl protease family protein
VSGDDTAQLTAAVLMLVLVGSSLLARRLPLGQATRMAAAWVAIFGIIFVGYSYREELAGVGRRVSGNLFAGGGQTVGSTLRVPMAEDGHFWVTAQVNGTELRFLVDSGATTTALSPDAARAARIEVDESGFPVMLETADGTTQARRARIERLNVGPIRTSELGVLVSPGLGSTNLLGMNFLSSLASWRVEGRTLVLVPKAADNG